MHVQGLGHSRSSTIGDTWNPIGDTWNPIGDVPPSAEPACQANGSSAPPVQTHTSDNAPGGSPGRITEPGQPLAGGLKIYRNISIVANTFKAAHDSVPHFVDVGASHGVTIAGNTMTSTTKPFDTEIHIYSSSGGDRGIKGERGYVCCKGSEEEGRDVCRGSEEKGRDVCRGSEEKGRDVCRRIGGDVRVTSTYTCVTRV